MKTEYDIIIVGAGPAGLAAAIAAAESGKHIALLDDNPIAGGQIWRAGPHIKLPKLALQKRQQIAELTNVTLINGAKIVAVPYDGRLLVELAEQSYNFHYHQLIICTGARELFLPFPGWTLPGVTGVGGLQALIKAGMPVTNQRVVFAGAGPLLMVSAATAKKGGAHIAYIAEQATKAKVHQFARSLWRWPHKLLQAMTLPLSHYRYDSYVVEALGKDQLEAVKIQTTKGVIEVACDRLACGFGLVPNIQLGQMLGCHLADNAIAVDQLQRTSQPNIYAAGECTGFGGSELAMVEGSLAGYAVIGQLDKATALQTAHIKWQQFADLLHSSFSLRPELKTLAKADTLLCRCEDVPFAKVAVRNNWIDAKQHTRCGMGACQGRTCASAAKFLFDWQLPNTRPPLFPTRVETLISMESIQGSSTAE